MQYNQAALPFSVDSYDPNAIDHNLPQSTWPWPPLNVQYLSTGGMQQVAIQFRSMVQSRVTNYSALHTFQFNRFAYNNFENQDYNGWVQLTAEFVEYLMMNQNEPEQQAVGKAVTYIYLASLGVTLNEYPQLAQYISREVYDQAMAEAQRGANIMRDIEGWKKGGMQANRPQGGSPYGQPTGSPYAHGGGGQNLPPVGGPAPRQSMHPGAQMGAVPHMAPTPRGSGGQQPHQGGQTGPTRSAGRYFDDGDSPNTWTAGQPLQAAKEQPQQPAANPQGVSFEDTNLPVPATLDDVVVDPNYYHPTGMKFDLKRPYDLIYNPGGVEIRPAHLTDWTRTRRDDTPYATAYDPTTHILFYVKWPDGVVDEIIMEITQEMNYLTHEINRRLRHSHTPSNGKVVPDTTKVLDYDAPAKPVAEVRKALDEKTITEDSLSPVILDGLFTASSDAENEYEARRVLLEELDLPEDTETVPAHEYITTKVAPLSLPPEGRERLELLSSCESMSLLAKGLDTAAEEGLLPTRAYRIINDQLTTAVNALLKDNLSLDLEIESFIDDIEELLMHPSISDPGIDDVIESNAPSFIQRNFNIRIEEDDGVHQLYLIDEAINLQLGWSAEEVEGLNLQTEATLLSKATHPRLFNVVYDLINRNTETKAIVGRHVRLITIDGDYIDVSRGWLVSTAVLLKKL